MWYVVAVVEIGINITVSSMWKVVSFKGTHLVQRMSLLTLIILGEGIIVIVKSIATIVKQEGAYTYATVGNILAAVLLIYFLYMLYFDWLNIHNHFGSIRQQIWAFLHFPFHLLLVLSLEGTAQVIIIRKVAKVSAVVGDYFWSQVEKFEDDNISYTMEDLVASLNSTIQDIFTAYPPAYVNTDTEVQEGLVKLQEATTNSTINGTIADLTATVQNSIFETYKIELPEKYNEMTSSEQLDQYGHVFGVLVSPNLPSSFGAIINKVPTTVYLLLCYYWRNNLHHESPELPLHFPQILGTPLPRRLASTSLQCPCRHRPLRHCSSIDKR